MQLAMRLQAMKLDELAEKLYGISGAHLMDNAATALFLDIQNKISKDKTISVFCGRGKNGGDGFLLAAKLKDAGYKVKIVLCFSHEDNIHPLTLSAMEKATQKNIPLTTVSDANESDVIIDAILGTGTTGEISGTYKNAIEKINSGSYVISVDIPSGLNCDNGKISNVCVKANETLTLGVNKIGLNIYPGAEYAGKVTLLDIGIPPECFSHIETNIHLVNGNFAKKLYPKRYPNSHKGTYGKVAVFGGSKGMTGSVLLAGDGVLRAGAGLSYLAVSEDIFSSVEMKALEHIVVSDKDYKKILKDKDAVVIGMGYLSNPKISHIMKVIQQNTTPVVVDAEGLNYIENKERKCPMIITPHPGEFSKLIGINIKEVNENRIYLSQKYAKENNITVVLKGAKTVVASPKGEVRIIESGTDAMATAGAGDVLAGLIGGFLAQGLSPFDAGSFGAYIHGLAGELAQKDLSAYSVKASDILNYIGKAMKENE